MLWRKTSKEYLEGNNLYNNSHQQGFLAGRSCLSQLLDQQDQILEVLCDVIHRSRKGFWQMPPRSYCRKSRQMGKIGRYIDNFLVGRESRWNKRGWQSQVRCHTEQSWHQCFSLWRTETQTSRAVEFFISWRYEGKGHQYIARANL